ncbi:hypothetical protein LEP3755_50340 [Leptolyngbya sp. NIES-3755]|nr:hypothetical protein LEP3755_50340 [Leptolyngbya sp. NIES-3755]
MADIYVAIRSQNRVAMPSIDGEFVIVLVTRAGQLVDQLPASMRGAMANFRDLPGGQFTVIVQHSGLNPTEARQDLEIPGNAIVGLRFNYNEPERRLLGIDMEVDYLP